MKELSLHITSIKCSKNIDDSTNVRSNEIGTSWSRDKVLYEKPCLKTGKVTET